MEFTAKQLAQVLKGTVEGDPQAKVTSFAKIEHGKAGQLCFFANPKYEKYVYTCKASILLVNNDFQPKEPVSPTLIRVEDAYKSLADLLKYADEDYYEVTPQTEAMLRFILSLPFSTVDGLSKQEAQGVPFILVPDDQVRQESLSWQSFLCWAPC